MANQKSNRFVILRARYRRLYRLIFCSPAEAEFIRVMGGKVFTLEWLKSTKSHFPFTLVFSMGPVLRAENIHREVRAHKFFLDFCNDLKRAIEIDGKEWHDIVTDTERDEYLAYYGYMVLHIKASSVFNNPAKVRRAAESWLLNGTLPLAPKQNRYSILKSDQPLKPIK